MSCEIENVRTDPDGNRYNITDFEIDEFDDLCDKAVALPEDEALVAWIDIRMKYNENLM